MTAILFMAAGIAGGEGAIYMWAKLPVSDASVFQVPLIYIRC